MWNNFPAYCALDIENISAEVSYAIWNTTIKKNVDQLLSLEEKNENFQRTNKYFPWRRVRRSAVGLSGEEKVEGICVIVPGTCIMLLQGEYKQAAFQDHADW